jgi:activator of HSP90 ATPase
MKDFKAYFIIPAEPEILYRGLTTEITVKLWTGAEATMSDIAGTDFSLWDDAILGKNLSFEPFRKIEQEWYFGVQDEPSIVTIKLHPHPHGTSMEVRQTNIPDDAHDDIVEGWHDEYAASLIHFYSE